jgi:hypothetical protein
VCSSSPMADARGAAPVSGGVVIDLAAGELHDCARDIVAEKKSPTSASVSAL